MKVNFCSREPFRLDYLEVDSNDTPAVGPTSPETLALIEAKPDSIAGTLALNRLLFKHMPLHSAPVVPQVQATPTETPGLAMPAASALRPTGTLCPSGTGHDVRMERGLQNHMLSRHPQTSPLSRIARALDAKAQHAQAQSVHRHGALAVHANVIRQDHGCGKLYRLGALRAHMSSIVVALRTQRTAAQARPPATQTPRSNDASALAKVTAAVHQRFTAQAANKPAFDALLHKAFGHQFDTTKAEKIRQQALAGDFSWAPRIEVIDSKALADTSGTQAAGRCPMGAYAKETDTLYISRETLHGDASQAQRTLMEEMGHGIDARINTTDAAGDEGEIFTKLMCGDTISRAEMANLKAENDSGVVNINGRVLNVEYKNPLKRLAKAANRGLKNVAESIANGVSNIAKASVNMTAGLATLNFNRVQQGFSQSITAVKTTLKEVHKAVKNTAKELHKITKETFQKLMQSKLFAGALMICRFIPIPMVQLVVRAIDMAQAAYMVYQGAKNKSFAMVLGGVASLASSAGKFAGALGASASSVATLTQIASSASKLNTTYNAIAHKDLGAALSLLGGLGDKGGALNTTASYAQQALGIRASARQHDTLGAIGATLAVAGNISNRQNNPAQNETNSQNPKTKDDGLGPQLVQMGGYARQASSIRQAIRNHDTASTLSGTLGLAGSMTDKQGAATTSTSQQLRNAAIYIQRAQSIQKAVHNRNALQALELGLALANLVNTNARHSTGKKPSVDK
jgi:hypothetical protein